MGERDTKQITRYFQQPDIVVEAVNIKSKKRKLTAKEEEEKARAYELNVLGNDYVHLIFRNGLSGMFYRENWSSSTLLLILMRSLM